MPPDHRGRKGGRRPAKNRPYARLRVPKELDIIHEDAEILIVNKPSGLVSAMPKPGGRPTLYDQVKKYARQRGGRSARAFVVHRLDLDASGLLIFAKTKPALDWLKDDLRARRIERRYLALVQGEMPTDGPDATGTVQSLLKEQHEGTVISVPELTYKGAKGGPDEAKPAITHYRVVAAGLGKSLVELKLETGRKHQIRVHMADLGHPLIGDIRYGSGPSKLRRLGLHASQLTFRHPGSGRRVEYFCPAPDSFYHAVGSSPPAPRIESSVSHKPGRVASIDHSPRSSSHAGGWDGVAEWYDQYQSSARSDHFSQVIIPGTIGLLNPKPGQRILDIACGEGRLASSIVDLGASVLGVDASPSLIEAARARKLRHARFEVGDARSLADLPGELIAEPFDAAVCVMALMNINPLSAVLENASALLRQGGRFVAIILHPAFRAPNRTSWGWEGDRPARQKQYRRVDAYLSNSIEPVIMNPGEVARGGEAVRTFTYNRPFEHYIKALSSAGLLVDDVEEWPSRRKSEPGPRAAEENRARREIPLFMAISARKLNP
ncbi:MAG TPA: methyltransferase domain-containing protein [Phycisphaerales bacterium]|nr:methyltransferase domain-containing protein [Phycisphaerales bacterium]